MLALPFRWPSFLILAAALSFAACSTPRPPKSEWVATRPDAVDLETARKQCQEEALAESDAMRAGLGAKVAGGTFFKCMKGKGWELRKVPE